MAELPATVDLDCYGGDTWSQTFRLRDGEVPHDLSAASVSSWARDRQGVIFHLDVTVSDQQTSPGELKIAAAKDVFESGVYSYDVEVTEAGSVKTWVRGTLVCIGDVTNA
jgi:hypothetical protein